MEADRMADQPLMLRPDVVVTTLENEAVLLDLDTKYFYSANLSGWAIAQLFEAGTSRARVAGWCRGGGATDEQQAAVAAFVQALVDERLIVPADASGPQAQVTFPDPWTPPTLEKYKEPLQRIMISAFDPTLPLAE